MSTDELLTTESSVATRVMIPLLSTFGSLLFFLSLLCIIYYLRFHRYGRIMLGPGAPGSFDDEQQAIREEAMYLHTLDEASQQAYFRAKVFQELNPPDSSNTDISLSQFLSIQEKGVSAWEFEPDLEATNCFVEYRTEIAFYDTECSVQTNLPIPKQNEMYYWEAKLYELPATTIAAIGVATKPYPTFRMPGFNRHSVSYLTDGTKRRNQPFFGKGYGPACRQGDVIGCGYKPRTGTVFFTRNGKKLEEAATNLKKNVFPTIGVNGPCSIHINFGQAGFVFIEANVKKWGLAPMTGTLQPPPAYGSSEIGDSVLLAAGFSAGQPSTARDSTDQTIQDTASILLPAEANNHLSSDISLANLSHRQGASAVPAGVYAPPDYTSDTSSIVDDGEPGPSGAQQSLRSDAIDEDEDEEARGLLGARQHFERM